MCSLKAFQLCPLVSPHGHLDESSKAIYYKNEQVEWTASCIPASDVRDTTQPTSLFHLDRNIQAIGNSRLASLAGSFVSTSHAVSPSYNSRIS
jgi:hypothetical protein